MKHVHMISRCPDKAAMTPLQIKLNGVMDIIDRLLLAQRQAAWKTPFPPDNNTDTDTNT